MTFMLLIINLWRWCMIIGNILARCWLYMEITISIWFVMRLEIEDVVESIVILFWICVLNRKLICKCIMYSGIKQHLNAVKWSNINIQINPHCSTLNFNLDRLSDVIDNLSVLNTKNGHGVSLSSTFMVDCFCIISYFLLDSSFFCIFTKFEIL